MRLTFLGHAAVQLEIGEYEVLIDPFLSGNPAASTTSEALALSHVLLTHGHGDHVGDTVAPAEAHGSVVIATVEIARWLDSQGVADAGDTALFSDLALADRKGLDLAFVPIDDHCTMGPDDAFEAVKLRSPQAVVPDHFDTFPPIHQDADAFRARVEGETDARCHVLVPADALDA